MLTAAVASTDATSSSHLRACLQQTGFVSSVREWTVSPKQHPGPGEPVPDIVVLDISEERKSYFAFAAHLRQVRPTVRIIACSLLQQPDPEWLLQAMRIGIREFLPKPVNPTKLRETLERFLQESEATSSRSDEKLIVVMGSKGGVGTSTVVVNLGVQLAQNTKKRVALLDFARPVGHVSLLLDLQPQFSLRDAIENLDRLDSHFFGGLLTRHKTGLEVLAGTAHPEEWDRIPVAALVRLVNVAQSTFDFVLIDYGSVYSTEWGSILRLVPIVLLVAEANVPALWTLERHLSATTALGFDASRIHIVINRWNRGDEETLKSVKKSLKHPIFACLPNDYRQVSEATNLGVPLSGNHNNRLVSEFRQLASRLAGVGPAVRTKSHRFTTLFSRSGRR